MSGKSRRHGKGKRITQSRKVMQRAAGVASPEVATTTGAAAGGGMITSVAPARQMHTGTALYPFVTVELRLIGILAIIILVLLIVLTLVLS